MQCTRIHARALCRLQLAVVAAILSCIYTNATAPSFTVKHTLVNQCWHKGRGNVLQHEQSIRMIHDDLPNLEAMLASQVIGSLLECVRMRHGSLVSRHLRSSVFAGSHVLYVCTCMYVLCRSTTCVHTCMHTHMHTYICYMQTCIPATPSRLSSAMRSWIVWRTSVTFLLCILHAMMYVTYIHKHLN
jgi:hypothetical protein